MVKIVIEGKEYHLTRMDKLGRVLIPKEIRDKINTDSFIVDFAENTIILKPVFVDIKVKKACEA